MSNTSAHETARGVDGLSTDLREAVPRSGGGAPTIQEAGTQSLSSDGQTKGMRHVTEQKLSIGIAFDKDGQMFETGLEGQMISEANLATPPRECLQTILDMVSLELTFRSPATPHWYQELSLMSFDRLVLMEALLSRVLDARLGIAPWV